MTRKTYEKENRFSKRPKELYQDVSSSFWSVSFQLVNLGPKGELGIARCVSGSSLVTVDLKGLTMKESVAMRAVSDQRGMTAH